jgi:prepilin-type N-terminal cleavage/methylation domain-containing protein
MQHSRQGFTLIELSIVLVVIGLIVGGVLAGQTLVHAAQLQNQLKQMNDYKLAFNTFVGKYGCPPGDCANATAFFGTTNVGGAVVNGNGNGQIDNFSGGSFWANSGGVTFADSPELGAAFQELAAAGMISFIPSSTTSYAIGASHPSIAMNSSAGMFFGASYNFYSGGSRNPPTGSYQTGTNALWFAHCASSGTNTYLDQWENYCAVFSASDLKAMDQKIDDGLPLSGNLFGYGGNGSPNSCLSGSVGSYTYNTSLSSLQCEAILIVN